MGPHPNDPQEHRDQYHHDPEHGETRFPPEESEQRPPGADAPDPHHALDTPADDVEPPVHNKQRPSERSQDYGNMGSPRKSRDR